MGTNFIEKWIEQRWHFRFVIWVCLLLAPVVFVLVIDNFLIDSIQKDSITQKDDVSQPSVYEILEAVPLQLRSYLIVASLLGIYLCYVWWRCSRLPGTIDEAKSKTYGKKITKGDWYVVQEMKERALRLHLRADCSLIFAIGLSVAGFYFVIFVLPEVPARDQGIQRAVIEAEKEAKFKEDYGDTLGALATGKHWLEIPDKLGNVLKEKVGKKEPRSDEDIFLTPGADDKTWKKLDRPALKPGERVRTVTFSSDGKVGIVVASKSFLRTSSVVFQTTDGGTTWYKPEGLELASFDLVRTATFSSNGEFGIVVVSKSFLFQASSVVFQTIDGGENWKEQKGLALAPDEWVFTARLSPEGQLGLVIGNKGSVFQTTDGGKTWQEPVGLGLKSGERVRTATFSPEGQLGLVIGNKGSVFQTTDGGKTWQEPVGLGLKSGERVRTATFSADGKIGILAGDEGSVFQTTDGGKTWQEPVGLGLKSGERVRTATFSADGKIGILAGDEGSVFQTTDGGKTWQEPVGLGLKSGERVRTATFSADGKIGILAGDEGSVFQTTDSGKTWEEQEVLALKTDEWVRMATFSSDGKLGILAGDEGSVFQTTDSGKTWEEQEVLALETDERVFTATLSSEGQRGVVVGNKGSVFQTTDGGKIWQEPVGLGLKSGERVATATFSADGNLGIAVDYENDEHPVFQTTDGGETWKEQERLALVPDERVATATFSSDGKLGILAGDEGSVFQTTDGGENWQVPEGLPLKSGERVATATFSSDGKLGILAGDEGSVFQTTDGGENWQVPEGLPLKSGEQVTVKRFSKGAIPDKELSVVCRADENSGDKFCAVAKVGEDYYFLLKPYNELDDWQDSPLEDLLENLTEIMKEYPILENGTIFTRLTERIKDITNMTEPETNKDGSSEKEVSNLLFSDFMTNLMAQRAVSLVILLLLVSIFIRLHRYSMQLAEFWESRVDAVLLSGSFAGKKAKRFDNLAEVLRPDSYDFKTAPKTPFDRFQLIKNIQTGTKGSS